MAPACAGATLILSDHPITGLIRLARQLHPALLHERLQQGVHRRHDLRLAVDLGSQLGQLVVEIDKCAGQVGVVEVTLALPQRSRGRSFHSTFRSFTC